ncbi:DUF1671-domain-containing protein [Ascobolus immersus RN42]|uniref:DUF1671-domain-containing protein n=1 Tax=Ascobolus immersus RN42 TaxID=1160509 RepID=A0A3N4IE07_ASCIM|nr:DUF1671-domain-containing protein [Ascobolus immersus RN42]
MTMLTSRRPRSRTPPTPSSSASSEIHCPFCTFQDSYTDIVEKHISMYHPEPTPTSSYTSTSTSRSRPYAIKAEPDSRKKQRSRTGTPTSGSGDDDEDMFSICDVEGCGEPIMKGDMQPHMDLHYAELVAMQEFEGNAKGKNVELKKERKDRKETAMRSSKHKSSHRENGDKVEKSSRKPSTKQPYVRRLGKSELGPYADEPQMPSKLRRQLEEGGKVTYRNQLLPNGTLTKVPIISNETQNLIFSMSQLCFADTNVDQAWLCHPGVRHVGKQGKEGGFCGYRNIQMLISYVQAVDLPTHPFGPSAKGVPNILKLQDWIEAGWDEGINDNGRIETGGIRGTRKYIGTSEAQTLFSYHDLPNHAIPFGPSPGQGNLTTQLALLDFVEAYFKQSIPPGTPKAKVFVTPRPPIYYQQRGHSMTIVGIERTKDGWQNLLVFDPVFTPSPAIKSLEGRDILPKGTKPEVLLRAYRRGLGHLSKFREFELLAAQAGQAKSHRTEQRHQHPGGHGQNGYQQQHYPPGRTSSGSSSGSSSGASRYY